MKKNLLAILLLALASICVFGQPDPGTKYVGRLGGQPVTTAQRLAFTQLFQGEIVYDTTLGTLMMYTNGVWGAIQAGTGGGGGGGSGGGLTNVVSVNVPQNTPFITNVIGFGAKCDAKGVDSVQTTATSHTITSSLGTWTSADIGKCIQIWWASNSSHHLNSTITGVNSATSITIADPAARTINTGFNTHAWYGTDDTVPVQAGINWCSTNFGYTNCGKLYFPGFAMVASNLVDPAANSFFNTNHNAQLILPDFPYAHQTCPTITFLGPGPVGLGYDTGSSNVVGNVVGGGLISIYDNDALGSVFSACSSNATDAQVILHANYTNNLNPVRVDFENFTIIVPPNPRVCALNLQGASGMDLENVTVMTGQFEYNGYVDDMGSNFGVMFPTGGTPANNFVKNVKIYGFYNDLEPGEHTMGGEIECYNAVHGVGLVGAGSHPDLLALDIESCLNGVYQFPGVNGSVVNFEICSENAIAGRSFYPMSNMVYGAGVLTGKIDFTFSSGALTAATASVPIGLHIHRWPNVQLQNTNEEIFNPPQFDSGFEMVYSANQATSNSTTGLISMFVLNNNDVVWQNDLTHILSIGDELREGIQFNTTSGVDSLSLLGAVVAQGGYNIPPVVVSYNTSSNAIWGYSAGDLVIQADVNHLVDFGDINGTKVQINESSGLLKFTSTTNYVGSIGGDAAGIWSAEKLQLSFVNGSAVLELNGTNSPSGDILTTISTGSGVAFQRPTDLGLVKTNVPASANQNISTDAAGSVVGTNTLPPMNIAAGTNASGTAIQSTAFTALSVIQALTNGYINSNAVSTGLNFNQSTGLLTATGGSPTAGTNTVVVGTAVSVGAAVITNFDVNARNLNGSLSVGGQLNASNGITINGLSAAWLTNSLWHATTTPTVQIAMGAGVFWSGSGSSIGYFGSPTDLYGHIVITNGSASGTNTGGAPLLTNTFGHLYAAPPVVTILNNQCATGVTSGYVAARNVGAFNCYVISSISNFVVFTMAEAAAPVGNAVYELDYQVSCQ